MLCAGAGDAGHTQDRRGWLLVALGDVEAVVVVVHDDIHALVTH